MQPKDGLEQDELAVALHDKIADTPVAVAGNETLAHKHAQILGERRVRVVDGLVLAHEAAQVRRDVARALLEAGIMTVDAFGQIYASFGDVQPDGAIGLRLYHKPLVLLIWLGAVVMALGGALSLSDRRMRVGAPARVRRAAAAAIPAE